MKKVRTFYSGSLDKLVNSGMNPDEWHKYFPRYLRESFSFECGEIKFAFINFIQFLLSIAVKIILQPRKGPVDELKIDEVERVYNLEAASYDAKHHLTTRGMDMIWRRLAGWFVVNFGRMSDKKISVLDICTGTGLTIREIVLSMIEWGIRGRVIGFDYNKKMLIVAQGKNIKGNGIEVEFVRGDAMNMAKNDVPVIDSFKRFDSESLDVLTQMLGIGGIFDPLKVFKGAIQILKPGGQYFLLDMHQPIKDQPGEWPFFLKWFRFPMLEAITYNKTTIPLVLNRLWAWRDTTMDFYLLPLVVFEDANGKKWGFKVVSLEVESHRWWLSLPIMPVAKMIVEKMIISDTEYEQRKKILKILEN